MWTEITRRQYERKGLRCASGLTDAEWERIGPRMPPPRRLGRRRSTELRRVVEAILYVLRSGCPRRLLPRDFPPRSTATEHRTCWLPPGGPFPSCAMSSPTAPTPVPSRKRR